MTLASSPIFCKGARPGVIRYWNFEVDGEKWRGHYGIVGGKDATSGWSTAKLKNAGKANQRSPEEQAHAEASAEEGKKLAREYRQVVEDLEGDRAPSPAVMLAHVYSDLKKPLIFNPKAVWSQPKLDGIRLVSEKRGGYSREFQPFLSTGHIEEALAPIFDRYPFLKLDGELYNHSLKADFNKIGSLVRSKHFTPDEKLELQRLLQYHVYDAPSFDAGFAYRTAQLRDIFEEFDAHLQFTPIIFVPTVEVHTLTEIDDRYLDYLEQGYEGQMIRKDEPYDFGVRSWSLLKNKGERKTAEFPISKLIEGNGNWAGYAKAVEYVLKNGTRGKAGIKGDQEFCKKLLTLDPAPTLVTVEFQGYTPDGMLRFPVAVDWHYGQRKD
jgi:DNA ligase-1